MPDMKLEEKIYNSFENTLQCSVQFFKTTAKHKSQQHSKLYNMHNMLKCIKYCENINLKLARGEQ